jgi:hypothetical protein
VFCRNVLSRDLRSGAKGRTLAAGPTAKSPALRRG